MLVPTTQNNGTPCLLTVLEAAELLRLHVKTIYAMIDRGDLPAIRIGRAVRFDRDELLSYLRGARG